MGHCLDCGGHTSAGVCSNCQEELYILQEQSEFIDEPVSDSFADAARAQADYLKAREA